MITLRHLKIFAAVAEYKKMSIAAKQLFISQPTISQTISDLEKAYNVKLFERFPKELRITPAGSVLLSHAFEVIRTFDGLNQAMMELDKKPVLRAGATLTVGNTILYDILDLLKALDSQLDVMVHIDNTAIMERKLLNNQLDIVISEGIITNSEILTEPILEDVLVLISSPLHPLAQKENLKLSDLTGQEFILREKGSGTREMFVNCMEEKHIPIRIKWECNSSNAIKQAVIHNHGLSVLSRRLVEKDLAHSSLCILHCQDFLWKRYFYLCYHRNKTITTEMKKFIQATYQFKEQS